MSLGLQYLLLLLLQCVLCPLAGMGVAESLSLGQLDFLFHLFLLFVVTDVDVLVLLDLDLQLLLQYFQSLLQFLTLGPS